VTIDRRLPAVLPQAVRTRLPFLRLAAASVRQPLV